MVESSAENSAAGGRSQRTKTAEEIAQSAPRLLLTERQAVVVTDLRPSGPAVQAASSPARPPRPESRRSAGESARRRTAARPAAVNTAVQAKAARAAARSCASSIYTMWTMWTTWTIFRQDGPNHLQPDRQGALVHHGPGARQPLRQRALRPASAADPSLLTSGRISAVYLGAGHQRIIPSALMWDGGASQHPR